MVRNVKNMTESIELSCAQFQELTDCLKQIPLMQAKIEALKDEKSHLVKRIGELETILSFRGTQASRYGEGITSVSCDIDLSGGSREDHEAQHFNPAKRLESWRNIYLENKGFADKKELISGGCCSTAVHISTAHTTPKPSDVSNVPEEHSFDVSMSVLDIDDPPHFERAFSSTPLVQNKTSKIGLTSWLSEQRISDCPAIKLEHSSFTGGEDSSFEKLISTSFAFNDSDLLQLRSFQLRLRNSSSIAVPQQIADQWFKMFKGPEFDVSRIQSFIKAAHNFAGDAVCQAIINSQDIYSNTALHYSIANGDWKVIELLLKWDVGINSKNRAGFSPPELATSSSCECESSRKILRSLFSKSAIRVESGDSLLMLACARENIPIVSILLDLGADSNYQNEDGWTALMFAAETGNLELVSILINLSPSSIHLRNRVGENAVAIAVKNGHKQIAVQIYSCNYQKSAPNTPLLRRRPNPAL